LEHEGGHEVFGLLVGKGSRDGRLLWKRTSGDEVTVFFRGSDDELTCVGSCGSSEIEEVSDSESLTGSTVRAMSGMKSEVSVIDFRCFSKLGSVFGKEIGTVESLRVVVNNRSPLSVDGNGGW